MGKGDTVLVTGASGFIAKHVIHALLGAGYSVRGTLRSGARGDEVRAAVGALATPERLRFAQADLMADAGWSDAMSGVSALIHTASPFPPGSPRDPDRLIRPAVEGTRRVLAAAREAGVTRAIQTSSVAAITGGHPEQRQFGPSDWTDVDAPGVSPYARSKTLAERVGWEMAEGDAMALTTINPAFVVGPARDRHVGTSVSLVAAMLRGQFPLLPRVALGVVDVRDVARLHVRALADDSTIGQRIVASERVMWFSEMASVLKAAYPHQRISAREAPGWLVRLLARVSRPIAEIAGDLDLERTIDGRTGEELAGGYIPAPEALEATAESLAAVGLVKKA